MHPSDHAHPLLADHRRRAADLLAERVYSYFATGAIGETAAGEATSAWAQYRLRPRVLAGPLEVRVETDLLGADLAAPILFAPTAHQGLAHAQGEVATRKGAHDAGILPVISARASRSIEDIGAAAAGPWWFQVYTMRARAISDTLVRRAVAAGASALVLTGDTPVVAAKHRLPDGPPEAVGQLPPGIGTEQCAGLSPHDALAQDPTIGVEEIGRLAAMSGLPVLVKGVLRGDDVPRLLAAGAAGIIVSNHGGRQFDRAVSTARALPEVVAAVAGRVPVLVDGGLRSGADILVALALGADAVLVGRPVIWALAAGGAGAVTELAATLAADLRTNLLLLGCPDPAHLRDADNDWLDRRN